MCWSRFLAILLLIALLVGAGGLKSLACAESGIVLLRPSFDMVVSEVPGENYVVIDRDPYAYILYERPINQTYRGTLDEEVYREVERRVNILWDVLRPMLEKQIPRLEESIGVKYWGVYPAWDEDPPALYVGLYKPTKSQMKAIVELLEGEAEKYGVVIKFYETLGHRGMLQRAEDAVKTLNQAYSEGLLKLPGGTENYLIGVEYPNIMGCPEITIQYGRVTDVLGKNHIVDIVRAFREFVDTEIPLLFYFAEKIEAKPDILYPKTNSTQTSSNIDVPEEPWPVKPAEIAYILGATIIITISMILATKRKRG